MFLGDYMVAFIEKSNQEEHVPFCRNRNRREHFKAITLNQDPLVRDDLTGRDRFADQDNFYSVRTVVDNLSNQKGYKETTSRLRAFLELLSRRNSEAAG